jgi:CheY-like chemotaxis protein
VIVCDETGGLRAGLGRYAQHVDLIYVRAIDEIASQVEDCPAHAVVFNAASVADLWPTATNVRRAAAGTPVVGCCVAPEIQQALEAGAMDYLIKPVTMAGVADVIETVETGVRRLLIVDDDADMRELLTYFAKAYDATLDIRLAVTGEEAIDALRTYRPDLVLLDIVLPGIDGWEVLAIKAEDEAIRGIPTVAVSGEDPRGGVPTTPAFLVTTESGVSMGKLMRCAGQVSQILLQPD